MHQVLCECLDVIAEKVTLLEGQAGCVALKAGTMFEFEPNDQTMLVVDFGR